MLIAGGVILFLAISLLLARVFSADGDERSAIEALLRAEARGDTRAMAAMIRGCAQSPTCQVRVSADAAALRHGGRLSILELNTSAGFSLTSTLGTARVAWSVGNSLPRVQCVRVRRAGNAFSGLTIELLELSQKIKSDAECPAHY
jgi:hypothetical protein